jgi:hypothetical protein
MAFLSWKQVAATPLNELSTSPWIRRCGFELMKIE